MGCILLVTILQSNASRISIKLSQIFAYITGLTNTISICRGSNSFSRTGFSYRFCASDLSHCHTFLNTLQLIIRTIRSFLEWAKHLYFSFSLHLKNLIQRLTSCKFNKDSDFSRLAHSWIWRISFCFVTENPILICFSNRSASKYIRRAS